MNMQAVKLDFTQQQATDILLPNPAALASSEWDSLHFELHQQPKFETPEHQGKWHVVAQGLSGSGKHPSKGERWLDGEPGYSIWLFDRLDRPGNLLVEKVVVHPQNWTVSSESTLFDRGRAKLCH